MKVLHLVTNLLIFSVMWICHIYKPKISWKFINFHGLNQTSCQVAHNRVQESFLKLLKADLPSVACGICLDLFSFRHYKVFGKECKWGGDISGSQLWRAIWLVITSALTVFAILLLENPPCLSWSFYFLLIPHLHSLFHPNNNTSSAFWQAVISTIPILRAGSTM